MTNKAEIPVTQEVWEAVMGSNRSVVKDPRLPVQNPLSPDIEKFRRRVGVRGARGDVEPGLPREVRSPGDTEERGEEDPASGEVEATQRLGPLRPDQPLVGGDGRQGEASLAPGGGRPAPSRVGEGETHGDGGGGENGTISMREFDDETGLGYTSNRFRIAVDE
jgi:hypothetical protein